jgi:hypothetical protein
MKRSQKRSGHILDEIQAKILVKSCKDMILCQPERGVLLYDNIIDKVI